MLREFLSGLKMNGRAMVLFLAQTKKAQERKRICKREKGCKKEISGICTPPTRLFYSCFCCCLLATFSPSFPYEKYGRNYLNLHLEWHKMLLNMVINMAFVSGNRLFINFTTENRWLIFNKTKFSYQKSYAWVLLPPRGGGGRVL